MRTIVISLVALVLALPAWAQNQVNPATQITKPNDATKFLNGTGAWTVPSGGGGSGTIVYLTTGSDICTQINTQAAILGPADGGMLILPAGALPCATTATVSYRNISIIGQGPKASIINCSVAGDCILLDPPLFDTTTTGDSIGPKVQGFSIEGTTAAGQVLIHTQDMIGWDIKDIFLDTPSTTGTGFYMENVTAWTERNHVRLQCGYQTKKCVKMFNDVANTFQPGSFGYNEFWFEMAMRVANAIGVSMEGNANIYNGTLHVTANVGANGIKVVNIQDTFGASWDASNTPNEFVSINAEKSTGTGTGIWNVTSSSAVHFYGYTNDQTGVGQGTAYSDNFYVTPSREAMYLGSTSFTSTFGAFGARNNDTAGTYGMTVTGTCANRTSGTCIAGVGKSATTNNMATFSWDITNSKGLLGVFGGSASALSWDSSGNAYLPTVLSAPIIGTDSTGKIVGTPDATVTYTTSQTAAIADFGKIVVMNCGAACTYTLPATQPSTKWRAWVTTTNTNATIVLGGTDTFNGSTSVPVLNPYQTMYVAADAATATNYVGNAPLVAGSNVTFAPASNGLSVSATASGGSGTSVSVNGGSTLTSADFNATTPAAPAGNTNVTFQVSGSSVSGYVKSPITTQAVVTASRAIGTAYQNTNATAMFVSVSAHSSVASSFRCLTDSSNPPTTVVANMGQNETTFSGQSLFFVVIPNNYYECTITAGTPTLDFWTEWH